LLLHGDGRADVVVVAAKYDGAVYFLRFLLATKKMFMLSSWLACCP
jgi:hypothetical protein